MNRKKGLTTNDRKTLPDRTFYGKEKKSLAYVIAIIRFGPNQRRQSQSVRSNFKQQEQARTQNCNEQSIWIANVERIFHGQMDSETADIILPMFVVVNDEI